jgi:DNA-directed RNA polymerase subunit M/transcription elongation factor TFIIS
MANANHNRDLATKMLQERFEKLLEPSQILDLERGIMDDAIKRAGDLKTLPVWRNPRFSRIYVNGVTRAVSNLESGRLIDRLVEGEFPAERVGSMTPEEMMPELWKPLIDKKMWKTQHAIDERPEAMTDRYVYALFWNQLEILNRALLYSFQCGRCKKNECLYQELQLRSADEPMTLFLTCLNCGNRWRM